MSEIYLKTANSIIKNSLKSAIFIDEKARPFFESKSANPEREEILSEELYKSFKKDGISLDVHKFQQGEEKDENLAKFFFEGRDLVLLDWKLNGNEGENLSLKLLSQIITLRHIHFCAIYTSEPNLDAIFNNIYSYFSNKNTEFYESLKEKFEAFQDDLQPLWSDYDLEINNGQLIIKFIKIPEIQPVIKETGIKDNLELLKYLYIAFNKLHTSEISLPAPEILSKETNTLVINNTIVTILNKDLNTDSNQLIEKLATQIAVSKNSFTQLLGFEMQSIFSKQSAFIDENLLQVSPEALFSHRNYMLKKGDNDKSFKYMIRNLLVEHASQGLRTARLSLLEENFLNEHSSTLNQTPSDDSLFAMNVFYNSGKVDSLMEGKDVTLSFGDVFIDEESNYYICITALCDCYRPSKINHNYSFAKGISIDRELALRLGDTAFISFLPNGQVVSWISPESDKDDEPDIEYYKQFKYKPIYIKPLFYHVDSEYIKENKIRIHRVESTPVINDDILIKDLTYISTIRFNYTQRIANHAFGHPIRVGVDFVKK